MFLPWHGRSPSLVETDMSEQPERRTDDTQGGTSPYGPQHGRVDDASGGADSSPFEAMSSDERAAALRQGAAGRSTGQPEKEG